MWINTYFKKDFIELYHEKNKYLGFFEIGYNQTLKVILFYFGFDHLCKIFSLSSRTTLWKNTVYTSLCGESGVFCGCTRDTMKCVCFVSVVVGLSDIREYQTSQFVFLVGVRLNSKAL